MQIAHYQEAAPLCLGMQGDGVLGIIPEELIRHLFSLLSCRSLAKVSSLNRKWHVYSSEMIRGYKHALYVTAFHLWHAFKLYHQIEARRQINLHDLEESFMMECLPASKLSPFEKATSLMREVCSKPKASERMFDGILKLDHKLKKTFAILLAPPCCDSRMAEHAAFYLQRALGLKNVIHVFPFSASQELKTLVRRKIEKVYIHPVLCSDPQVLNALKIQLPAFKRLETVVITSCHLDTESKGSLLPLLKAIDQVHSLRFLSFYYANFSSDDLYSIFTWIMARENEDNYRVFCDPDMYNKLRKIS